MKSFTLYEYEKYRYCKEYVKLFKEAYHTVLNLYYNDIIDNDNTNNISIHELDCYKKKYLESLTSPQYHYIQLFFYRLL